MTLSLVITSLVLFALLAIWRREWALYLIVLLLPTYQIRFKVWGIPATLLEGMILILAMVEAGAAWKQRSVKFKIDRRGIFIALFLLAASAAVFVSPVPVQAAGIWKAFFVEPVIFFFLTLRIINDERKLKRLVTTLMMLVAYLSVFGIYQFMTLESLPFSWWAVEIEGRRITSLVNHPNALALLLGPVLAFLIFLPHKTKLYWLTIAIGLFTLYLSLSRAAWLALLAAVLGLGIFTQHRKKILLAGLVLGLLVLVIPFSRAELFELINQGDPSRQNRLVLWTAAADMLKNQPLAGVGLAGFHEAYKNYPLGPDRVVQNYPHNFFLNFWLETGFLGLVSILALLIVFYKNRPPLGAAAAMTVILLHGMVDVPYFKNDLAVLFWLVYALGFITMRRSGSSPVLSLATS